MKTAACLSLLLLLSGCFAPAHMLCASRDLPAGTILEDSDLEVGDIEYNRLYSPLSPPKDETWGHTANRSRLIGHRLRHSRLKHWTIYLNDLD